MTGMSSKSCFEELLAFSIRVDMISVGLDVVFDEPSYPLAPCIQPKKGSLQDMVERHSCLRKPFGRSGIKRTRRLPDSDPSINLFYDDIDFFKATLSTARPIDQKYNRSEHI